MTRRKGPRLPVELRLDRLDPKGVSGVDSEGRRRKVGAGPLGARVMATPDGRDSARLSEVLEPSPDRVEPRCPAYGQCGGCQLQEVPLTRQRQAKADMVARLVGVESSPVRGDPNAYGTRNKLDLSWSTRAWLPQKVVADEDQGDFLGFHPPGWFEKIVPVRRCDLASERMNAVIAAVTDARLTPAWDPKQHHGVWRHLVVREGADAAGPIVIVLLVTSSLAPPDQVDAVARVVMALPDVRGFGWRTNDGVADVATGELQQVWGSIALPVHVAGAWGEARLQLDDTSFFQVNAPGAAVLFDTIGEALWGAAPAVPRGTLLDLYCGVGAIGLYLARHVEQVVGIELSAASIAAARRNCGSVAGRWEAGLVEDVLPAIWDDVAHAGPTYVVVDPPRVGLHHKAAAFLATLQVDVLVYVACNPLALARDRRVLEEGGWRLAGLWTVDLFPQTRHVEAVGRFVRDP